MNRQYLTEETVALGLKEPEMTKGHPILGLVVDPERVGVDDADGTVVVKHRCFDIKKGFIDICHDFV